jgi:hypothetical protein
MHRRGHDRRWWVLVVVAIAQLMVVSVLLLRSGAPSYDPTARPALAA